MASRPILIGGKPKAVGSEHDGARPLLGARWVIELDGVAPETERAVEALLTLADGCVGSRGSFLLASPHARPGVFMAGAYRGVGPETEPIPLPVWQQLDREPPANATVRRRLDLRAGLLRQEVEAPGSEPLRAILFVSLAEPGIAAMRVEGPRAMLDAGAGAPLRAHESTPPARSRGGRSTWSARSEWGSVGAAAEQRRPGERRLERLAAYARGAGSDAGACEEQALARLRAAGAAGFEALLRDHRAAWAERWEHARIDIPGEPELERSVRLALFHLISSVADRGEAAVGARGLTGPGYRGHVFWDSDVFVLPVLAATHPAAARAVLEYRIRRLPEALAAARRAGGEGARFPWESAASGKEVAPDEGLDRGGRPVAIRTGELEQHIVADVAWSACCYADWSGDRAFLEGPGRDLVVETARWWASRIELDADGSAHIRGVIGPDEYHEAVDDNAFTNMMARWNLRRGAELVEDGAGRARWLELAEALVDGYDPATGLYEQFDGFFSLEDVLIAEIADRPVSATMLLGAERVSRAQVLKQADVLMAHHLIPGEVAPGSLEANLSYYEPRTAHASSLSPGIHASLLARAGRFEQAREMLELTARIDRDDLTGTTAAGLHLAAMGSLWQAIAFGLAGLRPDGDALRIDPRLPAGWEELGLRVAFHGSRLRLKVRPGEVRVWAEPEALVRVAQEAPREVGPSGVTVTTTSPRPPSSP